MRNLTTRTEWQLSLTSQDGGGDGGSSDDSVSLPISQCQVDESGRLLVMDKKHRVLRASMTGTDGPVLELVGSIEYKEGDAGHCVALLDGDGGAYVLAAFEDGAVARFWPDENRTEVVGTVEGGAVSMCRSPDEELFLLATTRGSVVIMTRDLDPLTEVEATTVSSGTPNQFVSVGWGKKETQFHGSLGKAAAAADQTRLVRPSPFDDHGRVSLTWRGDGEFFAVSVTETPDQEDTSSLPKRRHFCVFDREGGLHSRSEVAVDGLEHCLAWKPSGSVLAAAARGPSKYELAVFEKNGLRHGGFTLEYEEEMVICDILWSKNSDYLLVYAKPTKEQENSTHILRVYTCSNYHWSLKKEWKDLGEIKHIQWDPTIDLR